MFEEKKRPWYLLYFILLMSKLTKEKEKELYGF